MMSGFKGRGVEGSIMTPKNWTLEAKFWTLGWGVKNDSKKSDIIYVCSLTCSKFRSFLALEFSACL